MTLAENELRHDPWLMDLLNHDPERAPYLPNMASPQVVQ
jgi:hypothetical protein